MMVGKKFLRFFLFWSYDFFYGWIFGSKIFLVTFLFLIFYKIFYGGFFVEKNFGVWSGVEFFREIFYGSDFLSGKNFWVAVGWWGFGRLIFLFWIFWCWRFCWTSFYKKIGSWFFIGIFFCGFFQEKFFHGFLLYYIYIYIITVI